MKTKYDPSPLANILGRRNKACEGRETFGFFGMYRRLFESGDDRNRCGSLVNDLSLLSTNDP